MRSLVVISLVTTLVGCGAAPRTGLEDESAAVGTVVQDAQPSALYRVHTTYDGPPVSESSIQVTFHINRQASASPAIARLDIDLVAGGEAKSSASGLLVPDNTEPNLVDLAWTNWCVQVPCEATADVTIELLPATGEDNAPVALSDVTAASRITYQTVNPDQDGVIQVSVEPIEVP